MFKGLERMNRKRYKWGDDVEGTCPNCFGRGRKIHLEYYDKNEVLCMVCNRIFKFKELKGGLK